MGVTVQAMVDAEVSGVLFTCNPVSGDPSMLGANLAADLAARGIHVAVLHPGFVRTEMTHGGGNIDPPESAAGLIRQIDALDATRSGRFFHADGSEVAW